MYCGHTRTNAPAPNERTIHPPPGHRELVGRDWHLVNTKGGDVEAWWYAFSFDDDVWYSEKTMTCMVRRRTWMRQVRSGDRCRDSWPVHWLALLARLTRHPRF